MWGIFAIAAFLIILGVEKIKEYSADKYCKQMQQKRESLFVESYGENRIRQQQLYIQYVCECKCLTKEEFDEAKRKTAELCKEINDPLMIEALTIDDKNPYEHPNPFIFERIYYYSTMSDYARYNLAKKRLEEEGYKWNDKFNLNRNTDESVELMKIYEYYNPDVAYLRNLK